jgi:hypothetical protein
VGFKTFRYCFLFGSHMRAMTVEHCPQLCGGIYYFTELINLWRTFCIMIWFYEYWDVDNHVLKREFVWINSQSQQSVRWTKEVEDGPGCCRDFVNMFFNPSISQMQQINVRIYSFTVCRLKRTIHCVVLIDIWNWYRECENIWERILQLGRWYLLLKSYILP